MQSGIVFVHGESGFIIRGVECDLVFNEGPINPDGVMDRKEVKRRQF